MFVVLEHSTGGQIHWDFIIEVVGADLLPTWRLLSDPLSANGPIRAERIADHRPAFLDHEGPLSEGRGNVRRVDRGESQIVRFDEGGLVARLNGELLHGVVELILRGDAWVCRFVDSTTET